MITIITINVYVITGFNLLPLSNYNAGRNLVLSHAKVHFKDKGRQFKLTKNNVSIISVEGYDQLIQELVENMIKQILGPLFIACLLFGLSNGSKLKTVI